MRWCNCGKIAIDGGFNYVKISSTPDACFSSIENLHIRATKQILLKDWKFKADKYGMIDCNVIF